MAVDFTVTHLSGSRQHTVESVRGKTIWLGRAEKCQIRFDPEVDRKVSGLHAELREGEDGTITVHDLGSKNGVLLDGKRVEGSAPVANRATIQLGHDGPRLQIEFETSEGGINFGRVRRDTRRKLNKDLVETPLLATDESLPTYTEEELGLTSQPKAPPAGLPPSVLALIGLALAILLLALYFALR